MKKRSAKILTVLILLLLLVPLFTVSAKSNGTFNCVLDIAYDEHEPGVFYWFGTLSECELAGTIRFNAVLEEYAEPGKTLHFVEEFTLHPYSGGEIKGKNWGVWNFSTLKFRANGWVTNATSEWKHLVGAKYHESGVSTSPEIVPLYVIGGEASFAPANRQPHALP